MGPQQAAGAQNDEEEGGVIRIAKLLCWGRVHITVDAQRDLSLRTEELVVTNRNGRGGNKQSVTVVCVDNGNIAVRRAA